MNNIKTIALFVVIAVAIFMGTKWYYGKEIRSQRQALRLEREQNAVVVDNYNERIGEYQTKLAIQEGNLSGAQSIVEEQRDVIKELEKDLDAKVEVVNTLTVMVDSLESAGVADIIVVQGDTLTYHIEEHKGGVGLDLTLKHPSGEYKYTIIHDPIKMELYIAREKGTDMKIGAIRFPNNPNLEVGVWDIFYDPDTRGWFEKIWDDVHAEIGVFGGADTGVFGFAGYKKVGFGPVLTEHGTSFGFIYRLK